MKLIDFFKSLFGKKNRFTLNESELCDEMASRAIQETAVRELALNAAINLIAGTIAKCEFKTFRNGKIHKGDEYYLFNVRPNPNESSAQFIKKWITRLYLENECLIIFVNDHAFVADSFSIKDEYALFPNIFTGVSANGFDFGKDFPADEVLYYRLNNEDMRRLLDMLYGSYKKMIESSVTAFTKSRGERGILETERLPGTTDYEQSIKDLMNDYFKPYFNSDNAVVPLFDGQKYTKVNTSGAKEITDAGDTRKLINDIFDMTAIALHIPPALLRGEMADSSQLVSNLLTFCVDPLCKLLTDEMNCKRYSKEEYLGGTYTEIDTTSIKHVDLFDVATAVDKLISSGGFCINDIREALGKPIINEPWASTHWITRNYQTIDSLGET